MPYTSDEMYTFSMGFRDMLWTNCPSAVCYWIERSIWYLYQKMIWHTNRKRVLTEQSIFHRRTIIACWFFCIIVQKGEEQLCEEENKHMNIDDRWPSLLLFASILFSRRINRMPYGNIGEDFKYAIKSYWYRLSGIIIIRYGNINFTGNKMGWFSHVLQKRIRIL